MNTRGRAMLPERMSAGRVPTLDQVLWVVHGPGTNDVLVGPDLVVRSMEETLWEALHGLGFDRIAFSSALSPLYFRDAESARSSTPGNRPARPGPRGRMRFVRSGPMGRRIVPGPGGPATAATATAATATAATATATGPGGERAPALSDSARVMTLRWMMNDATARTAVVILQAETLFEHLTQRDRRDLAAGFAEWLAGRAAPGNLCVLVSDRSTPEEIADFVAEQRYLPALANQLRQLTAPGTSPGSRQRTITRIGAPERAEIERLVHLARLQDGLTVGDWREFGVLMRQLASEQDTTARQWQVELAGLARAGVSLSSEALRERGLVTGAVPDGRSAADRLNDLVGLAPVKAFLHRRRARIAADAALGAAGPRDVGSPHLVFVGNPGTGKTTVARFVGEMYRDLGLLARGHVVECTRADLVAEHVGGTARVTRQQVQAALDGVLFIDEAYQLLQGDDSFGREAVETLLSEMENQRGRFVVVVAGYPDPMKTFLQANPGLPSRFPARNHVTFPDYSPGELFGILRGMLADRRLPLADDDPMDDVLRRVVAGVHGGSRRTFGNARDMRELADEIMDGWAVRVQPEAGDALPPRSALPPLAPEDVPERLQQFVESRPATEAEVLAELDHLIGLDAVKGLIRQLVNNRRLAARRGRSTGPAPHLILAGSPGTGKTTVARIIGRLFAAMGLLRSGHVVEVHRSHLVAGYVGQTAMKTRQKLEEALDGVLFIDEAYSLSEGLEGDFGAEALNEITAMMENHRGELVVIAAGYSDRMDSFLAVNEGLASRFTVRIDFPDYSLAELIEILKADAGRRGFTFAEGTLSRAARWLHVRQTQRGQAFGNARDVRVLLEQLERNLADRLAPVLDEVSPEEMNRLTMADVPRVDA